jgi:predicted component of type VI protein secretion system
VIVQRLETYLHDLDLLLQKQLEKIASAKPLLSLKQRWEALETLLLSPASHNWQILVCCFAQDNLSKQIIDQEIFQRLLLDEHLALPGGLPITMVYVPHSLHENNLKHLINVCAHGYIIALSCTPDATLRRFYYQLPEQNAAVVHYLLSNVTADNTLRQPPGLLSPQTAATNTLQLHTRFDGCYRLLSGSQCFSDIMICRLLQRLTILSREKIPGMADVQTIEKLLHAWLWPYCLALVKNAEQHLQHPIKAFSFHQVLYENHSVGFKMEITPHVILQSAVQTFEGRVQVGVGL